MITQSRAVPIASIVLFALIAPTTDGRPTPASTSSAAEQTVHPAVPEEYRPTAAAYAAMRTVDACGLLYHPQAVTEVTGQATADALMPDTDGLHDCTLHLNAEQVDYHRLAVMGVTCAEIAPYLKGRIHTAR